MRVLDRALTIAAYVLLFVTVTWLSYDLNRTIADVEENTCATAEIAIANEVFTLAIIARQEDVDESVLGVALSTYVAVAERIQERCGLIFLDDIELPTTVS